MQFIILFVTQQCWIINFAALECQFSHRSRINTDQFPKRVPKKQASRGIWGILPQKTFFGISTPKSLLSHSDRIFTVCPIWQISIWKIFWFNFIIIERSDQFLCLQLLSIIIIIIIVTNFSVQRWPALCSNPKEPTKKCKPWTRWSWDSPLSITAVCGPLSQCSNWFWIYPLQRLFAWVDHMINFR